MRGYDKDTSKIHGHIFSHFAKLSLSKYQRQQSHCVDLLGMQGPV